MRRVKIEPVAAAAHVFAENHQCEICGIFDELSAVEISDCSVERNGGILCYAYKAMNYTEKMPRYDLYIKSYNNESHLFNYGKDAGFKTSKFPFSHTNILNTNINRITFVNKTKLDKTGYRLFSGCDNAKYIDVSNLDVSEAENVDRMFSYCSSLLEVNVGEFNARKAKSAQYMFVNNWYLRTIKGHIYFENVENLECMFDDCHELKNVDFSGFNVENVTTFSGMFYGCESLVYLDLSNFKNSKATYISHMFEECDQLSSVDLSGFDTVNLKSAYATFQYTENLKKVYVSNKWILSENCDTKKMFNESTCSEVTVK